LADEIRQINSRIKMVFITAFDNITKNDSNLEIVKKPRRRKKTITNNSTASRLTFFL
jgi:two-component SAPR family response regulator